MGGLTDLIWAAPALALAGCTPAATGGAASNGDMAAVAEQVALKGTTALSLAELAYNSGEAAATAALDSGALTKTQDQALGDAVQRARRSRDQARGLIASGGDASATIEALDRALTDINTLTGN
ncbi:hypothetical protein EAH87_13610 [Sphingomonas koreensis]|nr:hypothetical protein EAH87_13610 [Sphingomonas koreensis]